MKIRLVFSSICSHLICLAEIELVSRAIPNDFVHLKHIGGQVMKIRLVFSSIFANLLCLAEIGLISRAIPNNIVQLRCIGS